MRRIKQRREGAMDSKAGEAAAGWGRRGDRE